MNTNFLSHSLRLLTIAVFVLIYLQSCESDSEEVVLSPQITRLSPESGLAGSTLFISGKGFSTEVAGNVVKIDGVKADIQEVQGDTLIKVFVPEHATSGMVQVTVGKQLANGPLFIVARNPNPPVITSVMPTTVNIGDVITITGKNFKTGSELDQNTVRISGLKVTILSGSDTELKVVVPGVPKQPTVPVTVSVLGTPSNELSLKVNGFDGKLVWMSVSVGRNGESKNIVYRVIANADGSSLKRDEQAIPSAQQKMFFGSNGIPVNFLSAYHREDNVIYFYSSRVDFDPVKQQAEFARDIWKAGYSLNNFTRIYKLNYQDERYDFYDMIPSVTHHGFYLRNNQLKAPGSWGLGYTVYEGLIDGGGDNTLLDKLEILPPPGPYGNSPVAGTNTILIGDLIFPFDNTAPKAIDIAGDPTAFIQEEYCYNPDDDRYYFFANSTSSGLAGIFRVSKSGGKAEKLVDIDTRSGLFPRYLQALTTPAGTKLFWVQAQSVNSTTYKTTGIYYANLSNGEPPYNPVLLYAKPQEIQSDPGTRPALDFGDYNIIKMFYVIPNN